MTEVLRRSAAIWDKLLPLNRGHRGWDLPMKPSGRNAKPIQAQGPKLNLSSAPPQRFGCATRQWHVVSLPPRRGWWPPFSEGLATTLLHVGRDNRTMWRCWHLDSLLFIAVCQHLAQIVDFFQEHVILRPSENSGNQSGIVANQFVTPTTLKVLQPHWHAEASSCTCKANGAALGILSFARKACWSSQTFQHVPTVLFQACCVHSLSPRKEWLALGCHPHGLPSLLHVRKKEAFPCSTGQTRGQIWVTSCVQPSFPGIISHLGIISIPTLPRHSLIHHVFNRVLWFW